MAEPAHDRVVPILARVRGVARGPGPELAPDGVRIKRQRRRPSTVSSTTTVWPATQE